jgi:hypothetical protein
MLPRRFRWRAKWQILSGLLLIPVAFIGIFVIDRIFDQFFGASVLPAVLTGVCLLLFALYLVWTPRHEMWLCLPVCASHRSYWKWRELCDWRAVLQGSLCIPVIMGGVVSPTFSKIASPTVQVGIGITLVSSVAVLIMACLVVQFISIHPARIDEQSIILKYVSAGFAKVIGEAHVDAPPSLTRNSGEPGLACPTATDLAIAPAPAVPPDSRIQPGSP